MRRIILAEDQGIVITGMRYLLGKEFPRHTLDVVKNCAALTRKLKAYEYSLAIIDLQLDDGSIIQTLLHVLTNYRKVRVLVFSSNAEEIVAQPLYAQGIRGYLTKDADEFEIVEAVRSVLDGNVFMSGKFANSIIKRVRNLDQISAKLTESELQILLLLMKGAKGNEVSTIMGLKPSTISNAKKKIFQKLKVDNILEVQKLLKSSQHYNNLG